MTPTKYLAHLHPLEKHKELLKQFSLKTKRSAGLQVAQEIKFTFSAGSILIS
jgi:hypothetical protein